MTTRFVLAITLSLGVAFFGIGGSSFIDKGQAQEIERSPKSDRLALEVLFRMVSSFENEANRRHAQGDTKGANAFRNFFIRKAKLDEAQAIKLKQIALDFARELKANQRISDKGNVLIDANALKERRSQNYYIDLIEHYRARLLAESRWQSRDFIDFLDNEIRRKITMRWNQQSRMLSFGYSSVDYETQGDEIVGYSVTYDPGSSNCGEEQGLCYGQQVYATLSSDLAGILDTQDSGEVCGENAEVFLYYSQPEPSRYCVGADHLSSDDASPNCNWQGMSGDFSNACVTVTLAGMQSVEFQLIGTGSPPIDANPPDSNTLVDDGLRIFPDRNAASDSANRQAVRVRASLSEQIAGRTIYFANFDLDDPSTDTTVDPNGTTAADNRGLVAGSGAGQLTPTSTPTNSQGQAAVDFTVTMQPGDNFAVVATTDPVQLNGIQINGTELRTAGGALIESNCDGTETICRSEMLTVWRRLHIEVDSMGPISGNFVSGTIPDGIIITPNSTENVSIQPSPAGNLEVNRFENGRLALGGNSLFVNSNTINTVSVTNATSSTITIVGNSQFQLYDDDDFEAKTYQCLRQVC